MKKVAKIGIGVSVIAIGTLIGMSLLVEKNDFLFNEEISQMGEKFYNVSLTDSEFIKKKDELIQINDLQEEINKLEGMVDQIDFDKVKEISVKNEISKWEEILQQMDTDRIQACNSVYDEWKKSRDRILDNYSEQNQDIIDEELESSGTNRLKSIADTCWDVYIENPKLFPDILK